MVTKTRRFDIPYPRVASELRDALIAFDALIHPEVIDQDLTAPPGGETTGDTYIIGSSATGDWSGRDGQIAIYHYTGYTYVTPWEGFTAWVADEDVEVVYDGSAWQQLSGLSTVSVSGTPVDNQVAVWTSATAIEGDSGLTWDGSTLDVGGSATITPNTSADDLVIDKGAANTGLSIISTGTGNISFGDAANANMGTLSYAHSSNTLTLRANNGTQLTINVSTADFQDNDHHDKWRSDSYRRRLNAQSRYRHDGRLGGRHQLRCVGTYQQL